MFWTPLLDHHTDESQTREAKELVCSISHYSLSGSSMAVRLIDHTSYRERHEGPSRLLQHSFSSVQSSLDPDADLHRQE